MSRFRSASRLTCETDGWLERGIEWFHYREYADEERFRRIYHLFSRDAVAAGSLARRAAELPTPRGKAIQRGLFPGGYQPIDQSFLLYLKNLRLHLARSFFAENPRLTAEHLVEATQRTVDRLIFMRFLEDKLIEPDPIISEFGAGGGAWADFVRASGRLNAKYNGVVFGRHFIDEEGFAPPPAFAEVCDELAHYNTPYDFNAIPIPILGAIYEQFLGEVLTVEGGRVTVEAAPEARRSGGVYYTPAYIVQQLVEEAVGEKVEGRTPREVAGVRIVDISCRSGSFLLGAYDALLRYHGRWYQDHPKAAEKDGCHNVEGLWVLSLKQKRAILTNNIYGVDIDPQAVEVAQLSLFLKLLEDETTATANEMQVLFKEKILPDLGSNIVSGNALIGFDRFQDDLFGEDARRVNPLDFDDAFPDVMAHGGFDVVLGNPPYINIETLRQHASQDVPYYLDHYTTSGVGRWDIYLIFVERGLRLLNADGRLGYILPNRFFTTDYGEGLRRLLSSGRHVGAIVDFGSQQVFKGATTYTCLLHLSKRPQRHFTFTRADDLEEWRGGGATERARFPAKRLTASAWNIATGAASRVFDALQEIAASGETVGAAFDTPQGIRTSANDVYVLRGHRGDAEIVEAFSKRLGRVVPLERESVMGFLKGREIKPFEIRPTTSVVVYPYRIAGDDATLVVEGEMRERWPLTYAYLSENRERLEKRKMVPSGTPGDWYEYGRDQNIATMPRPKVLVADNVSRASFALDAAGTFAFVSGYAIVPKPGTRESLLYALGLLNSAVLDLHIRQISNPMEGGFFRYFSKYIAALPLPRVDFADPQAKALHDKIVDTAERLRLAMSERPALTTDHERQARVRAVRALSGRLNQLAYAAFGLGPGLIDICEAHAAEHPLTPHL